MKKRWTGKIVLLVLIGLFVFGIVMIVSNNKKQDRRNRAASLFHQKRYEESLAIWEEWDDENAERWQEKCRLEIINQKIKDLMENEKAAEALDMLYKEYPESPLIGEVIFARAKELVGQNKPEEALALMQTIEAPDVEFDRYKKDCEAAVAIKQFRAYMEEGEYSKAYDLYDTIDKDYLSRLPEQEKEELSLLEKKAEAGKLMQSGEYGSAFIKYKRISDKEGMKAAADGKAYVEKKYDIAFHDYKEIPDEEGMRAMVDMLENEGQYADAFSDAMEFDDPDIARLESLFDKYIESGSHMIKSQAEIALDFKNLCKTESEEAKKLAEKIIGQVVSECNALMEEDHFAIPFYVLSNLHSIIGDMWTEELEEMHNRCLPEIPQNYVRKGKDLLAQKGAVITVYNNSKNHVLFTLRQLNKPDPITGKATVTGKTITVFVASKSNYTFVVSSDYYDAHASVGQYWFGKDGLGFNSSYVDVQISDYYNPSDRYFLQGSYSTTFK